MIKDERNIVLIGMPGCGKTTIGRLLAHRLCRSFIDIESYIEKQEGCTINSIFHQGEEVFRRLEAEAVLALEAVKASVITTGGGIVKNALNMKSLHKNGIIVYIDRSIEDIAGDIDISTRPLLANGADRLVQLYTERHELYQKYSDFTVENKGTVAAAVENIIWALDNKSIGGSQYENNCNKRA